MENSNYPANQNLLLKTFMDAPDESDSQSESMSAAQRAMAKFMLPPSIGPYEKPKIRVGGDF